MIAFLIVLVVVVGGIVFAFNRAKTLNEKHTAWARGFDQVCDGWFLDNVVQVMGEPCKVVEDDDRVTYYYGLPMSNDVFYITFKKGRMQVVGKKHFKLPDGSSHRYRSGVHSYTPFGRKKFFAKCENIRHGMSSVDVMDIMGGRPDNKFVDLDCVVWEFIYGSDDSHGRRLHADLRVWLDLDENRVVEYKYG